MSAMNRIRQAAIDSGWTIKARKGQEYQSFRGTVRWDRDIFNLGSVDRHLENGTPVTEPEHSIEVWYRRDGAVHSASGHQATVERWIYHDGVLRDGKHKAERIVLALINQTSDIPPSH